jgi:hypothetical protein
MKMYDLQNRESGLEVELESVTSVETPRLIDPFNLGDRDNFDSTYITDTGLDQFFPKGSWGG